MFHSPYDQMLRGGKARAAGLIYESISKHIQNDKNKQLTEELLLG